MRDFGFTARYSSEAQINYAINISLRFDYIYVETPKVACSTIKRFLIKNEYPDIELFDGDDITDEEFEYIHLREFSPLLNPRQLYPFRNCLDHDRFYKFCFVRNPYDRLVSAYNDKIVNQRPPSVQIKAALGRDRRDAAPISFADFVRVVCEMPIGDMDSHWKIQYYQIFMDEIDFDFVGRMETFDRDISEVCRRTGLDKRHLRRFAPHARRSQERTDSLFTPELRDRVYAKYRKDFEHFDYDK